MAVRFNENKPKAQSSEDALLEPSFHACASGILIH